MILEHAILNVKPGLTERFETDFITAGNCISSIKGYINHSLQRCIEDENKYLLLVKWEKLENHTVDFRKSEEYQFWKKLLHHYYEPFPVVEHFKEITFD